MATIDNKLSLGFFPTPLQELKNLSQKFPEYTIYIKRDDHTGLASGGNKTRKLEYLVKHAIDEGCDTIITSGAQQSNHCRQTAAACAIAGLKCHLLLGGNKPEEFDGNLLLSSLLGATIHFTGDKRKGEDEALLKEELKSYGNKAYIIPYGGSNLKGAMGFINAVRELKEQLSKRQLNIDYIFFASSSGGMQAGLTLGIEIYKLNTKLIPINIDKDEIKGQSLEAVVYKIVEEGLRRFNINKTIRLADIALNRDYDNDGYGVLTDKEVQAIKELAKSEGIVLDPVYTGRAFYGMLDILKKKKLPSNSNVLFWNTGGMPALFKYANDLNNYI